MVLFLVGCQSNIEFQAELHQARVNNIEECYKRCKSLCAQTWSYGPTGHGEGCQCGGNTTSLSPKEYSKRNGSRGCDE